MKVLAIVGTKRKTGNTANLCQKVLEGARDAGHTTEMVNLYDYTIEFCKGCWACTKKGRCVINDDFSFLFEKIAEADCIVLGSPCYWGNVTGIMKAFFDRHTGHAMYTPDKADTFYTMTFMEKITTLRAEMKKFGPHPHLKGKKFIFVVAMTDPIFLAHTSGDLRQTLAAMKIYMHNLQGKCVGKIIYTDTLFKFLQNKQEKLMQKAYGAGKSLPHEKLS